VRHPYPPSTPLIPEAEAPRQNCRGASAYLGIMRVVGDNLFTERGSFGGEGWNVRVITGERQVFHRGNLG
jgi:hypothetical protein